MSGGRVVLLGHPVAHSLSPAMHNAAFAALGLPHRYDALDVSSADLPGAFALLRRPDVLGANLTVPHKEAAVPLVDDLSAEARRIGAVNTVVKDGARLMGDNTDALGFAASLRGGDGAYALAADTVLVLGAGGAARACILVLLEGGSHVLVASRSRARADALARSAATSVGGRGSIEAIDWADIGGRIGGVGGVVNATPLGLHGEDPLTGIALPRIVVDIVPTAEETPLVARARRERREVVDGLSMLLYQAAASFERWTGRSAPLDVMRRALPRPA